MKTLEIPANHGREVAGKTPTASIHEITKVVVVGTFGEWLSRAVLPACKGLAQIIRQIHPAHESP